MLTLALANLIEAIPRSAQILLDQDLEGAEYQILADDEMDERTIEIEARCTSLLALHAPVAGELRRVVAVMKMAADVERALDLVVNICRVARRIHGHPLDPGLRGLILRMSGQAQMAFNGVLRAFLAENINEAESVGAVDVDLDQTHRAFIQAIFESHAEGRIDLPIAVQMAVTGRFLERIGDHAVNCAGLIRYVITGDYPNVDVIRPHRRLLDETPIGGVRAPFEGRP